MDIVSYSEEAIQINIFVFKVSNRNTRKRCELCSELRIKTDITTMSTSSVSLVDFEQGNV